MSGTGSEFTLGFLKWNTWLTWKKGTYSKTSDDVGTSSFSKADHWSHTAHRTRFTVQPSLYKTHTHTHKHTHNLNASLSTTHPHPEPTHTQTLSTPPPPPPQHTHEHAGTHTLLSIVSLLSLSKTCIFANVWILTFNFDRPLLPVGQPFLIFYKQLVPLIN